MYTSSCQNTCSVTSSLTHTHSTLMHGFESYKSFLRDTHAVSVCISLSSFPNMLQTTILHNAKVRYTFGNGHMDTTAPIHFLIPWRHCSRDCLRHDLQSTRISTNALQQMKMLVFQIGIDVYAFFADSRLTFRCITLTQTCKYRCQNRPRGLFFVGAAHNVWNACHTITQQRTPPSHN